VSSTVEYNWFDRAKSYVGDLMTSDDYANNPTGSLLQSMTLRGNVIVQGATQANDSQLFAVYNDEASGSPVSFSVTALYNTVVGAGGHAAFVHLSNADATNMTGQLSNNIISGTSQPVLVEDTASASVSGNNNWLETGADTTSLSGSIVGDSPGFTNAAGDDFTLAAGSACIGAADTAVPDPPTAEYYENEVVSCMYRVRLAALDLGAFEHDTTGPGIGPTGAPDGGAGASGGGGAGGASATGTASSVPTSTGRTATSGTTSSRPAADAGEGGEGGAGASGSVGSSSGCHCATAPGPEGAGLAALGLSVAVALTSGRRRQSFR
jgi:MYXO-CTERM domain-containing protein